MKNLLLLLGVCTVALLSQTNVQAQNIFSGEPVQVVGQMNGYNTSSAANSAYRRVSVNTGNPVDGRGQWMKTYNAQSSGGDVLNSNMGGGGGNGFLFISGPASGGNCGGRYNNKWVFSGVGQGALNAINNISAYSNTCGGTDMGLNMGTAGRYTFVFNDCGYTQTNAKFYVGYTANAPVTVTNGGVTFSNSQPVVSITTSGTPSSGENIYVRYRATNNDFTTGTSVVQATGSGTSWSATLPQQTCGSTVYYYVYTSTRSLAQINADAESDRTLATLRYDDNAGANYSFSVSPVPSAAITNNSGTTVLTCATTAISVTATGGVSYSWDNGLGSGASKSITAPGTYTVTVTGANGCTSTAQIVITQDIAAPTAGITNNTGSTLLTCAVTSISVTATGGVSYSWDNGLGSGASKSITALGTYTVTATAANGCTDQESIDITQNIASPNAGITNNSGTTILTCAAPSISVTATGSGVALTYSWDGGATPGTAANTFTAPGTYTVTVTRTFTGCTDQESIIITQDLSNNTFSGTGDWSDGTKWSCGTPPGSGSIITIAAGSNVTLNTDFTVAGSLTMQPTSTLTINPAKTLTVSGSADFAGQSVTFKSDATGTASLGQVTGTLSGATNVTVERYIPNNNFRSWRLLSVPTQSSRTIRQEWQEGDANPLPKQNNVAGYGTQITGVFTTQAAAAAAGFDSTSISAGMLSWTGSAWANVTSTNQPINNNNKSWFLYIRGDRSLTVTGMSNSSNATTLRTKGTIYTGDQVNNIGANAFALVPNLYPSAISFTGLTRTGGVSNLFYIWDSKKLNGQSLGAYQTFSGTNGFLCLLGGGSYTLGQPNTTIESGQSFFVQSTSAGTLTLKESAKVSAANGNLGFRPSGPLSKIDTRLLNKNGEMIDANAVVFNSAYTKAVAEEDAPKLGNPGVNFAIESNSKLLAVEGTQPVKAGDVIQYRMWNLDKGTYQLEIAAQNMAAGIEATLEDSYLKTATPVNMSSNTTVSFSVDQNAGSSAANRFRLVFGKARATAQAEATFTVAPNPIENGTMNIVFQNQKAGRYSVRLVSADGRTVLTRTLSHAGGNANQSITLPASITSGAYTVEISSAGNSRSTQTVLVNRK